MTKVEKIARQITKVRRHIGTSKCELREDRRGVEKAEACSSVCDSMLAHLDNVSGPEDECYDELEQVIEAVQCDHDAYRITFERDIEAVQRQMECDGRKLADLIEQRAEARKIARRQKRKVAAK